MDSRREIYKLTVHSQICGCFVDETSNDAEKADVGERHGQLPGHEQRAGQVSCQPW